MFSVNTLPPDSGLPDCEGGKHPQPVGVGGVSYGVRVLANLSVTFNSQQEAADFKASYSGWGVSANVNFDQLSSSKSVNSTINCYVVGSPEQLDGHRPRQKDLKKEIQQILAGATYKNAMPVKYEFYDMAGEVVGSNSATDDFAVRNCTPGKDDPRLESVYVNFSTGNDNKNQNDNYVMFLYPGAMNKTVSGSDVTMTNSLMTYLEDGAVFDFGSGYNSPEYPNNSQTQVQMFGINKPATLTDFQNGGSLHLHLEPENTDTWVINSITVTLNFAGSVTPPKKSVRGDDPGVE